MSLKRYNERRSFNETPEPKGTRARLHGKNPLHFVVQKHAARALHYDFRLEVEGVLKSWAVPKGPSMDPKDKRLAIMTEDHPLEYGKFHGTIPKGHYGAGTVEIWDSGVYSSLETTDPIQSEKKIKSGLHKGEIKFLMQGGKLQGGFALIKMKGRGENSWLLVKERDEYARDSLQFNKKKLKRGIDPMPRRISPMLAKLVSDPFDKSGWFFERKWDGYRAIAEIKGGNVSLYSRSGKAFDAIYQPVSQALKRMRHDCVLDGEIVAIKNGREDFHTLQQYQEKAAPLRYEIFDLLYLDGADQRKKPLHERKDLLRHIIPKDDVLRYSDHVLHDGKKFFAKMRKEGREGMIAKNAASPYKEGERGDDWLKIKSQHEQEAIIIGFTKPRFSRKYLGALVLGAYVGNTLRYIGHSGGGFTEKELKDLYGKLKKIATKSKIVQEDVPVNSPITWVKPQYVCQVKFTEWTPELRMRHPVYIGLRIDKKPGEVVRELLKKESFRAPPTVAFSNLDKVFWPKERYTKGDLIAYYESMAETILPYLKDRPQNLNRYPNGITGENFYQKNITNRLPDFVQTTKIWSDSNNGYINYILCQNKETLLYLANLGCIEINPWNSRIDALENPDYMILDLDPHEISLDGLIEVARVVKDVLDLACKEHFIKTSGKSGLHVCVPLGARYTYDDVRLFAEILMRMVHMRMPDITSIERNPKKRKGKMYLDYLQNSIGQTLACAYSVRPHAGATVSTPLEWSEVKKGLDPAKFTIKTIPERLKKKGDLWSGVLSRGIDLREAIQHLQKNLNTKI